MSSNNQSEAATGFAVLVVACAFMGMVIFALLAFLALVISFVSIAAWNKPRKFCGSVITPDEAHAFIRDGAIGSVALPLFAAFSARLFEFRVDPDFWSYLIIGGYSLGSVGMAYVRAQAEEEANAAAAARYIPLPQETIPTPSRTSSDNEPTHSQPFRFASWDDEEELRK